MYRVCLSAGESVRERGRDGTSRYPREKITYTGIYSRDLSATGVTVIYE